jgi:hypothetical protein
LSSSKKQTLRLNNSLSTQQYSPLSREPSPDPKQGHFVSQQIEEIKILDAMPKSEIINSLLPFVLQVYELSDGCCY